MRIYAVVAGSTKQGPENDLTDLVYGDFTIHFILDELVTACMNNELINNQADVNFDKRTSPVVYQTGPLGEEAEEM
jgi:hypothetical protein